MSVFERIEKISALLASASSQRRIESKKKLHKLVYLLQQLGEDFDEDFIFHHFGVFSPTLASDLDFGERVGQIVVDEPHGDDWAYQIRLTQNATSESEVLSDETKAIISRLAAYEPQLLETLSTVVYLNRNYYEGRELEQKLRELKPDLERHYEEAFKLASELYGIRTES